MPRSWQWPRGYLEFYYLACVSLFRNISIKQIFVIEEIPHWRDEQVEYLHEWMICLHYVVLHSSQTVQNCLSENATYSIT